MPQPDPMDTSDFAVESSMVDEEDTSERMNASRSLHSLFEIDEKVSQLLLSFLKVKEVVALKHCSKGLYDCATRSMRVLNIPLQFRASHRLTDADCVLPLPSFPNLTHLKLKFCSRITDQCLKHIVQLLPGLQHIELEGCRKLTDQGMINLSNATELTSVNIKGLFCVSAHGVVALLKKCPSLHHVHLDGIGVNDNTLLQMSEHKIRTLSLAGCPSVTDSGILGLTARLGSKLESLCLAYSAKVTDASVAQIASKCNENLKILNLYGCSRLTDNGVSELKNCSQLSTVNLSHCPLLSDTGVTACFTRGSKNHVQHVDISNCGKLTDASIDVITQACPDLRTLGCFGLDKLTIASVVMALDRCPNIVRIDVNGCALIGEQEIAKVQASCPHVAL